MKLVYFMAVLILAARVCDAQDVPAHLPGELSAEQVLNGEYPFPPSPKIEVVEDVTGFRLDRLTKVPPPGVHPRVLLSPDDVPDLRRRLAETEAGRAMMATLRQRTGETILKPGTWENEVYTLLADGRTDEALKIIGENRKPSFPAGHYQPGLLYALAMESFDAMVSGDAERGRKVGAAIAGWAKMIEPLLEESLSAPLNDDVWRAKIGGPVTGSLTDGQGLRGLLGGHLLGYCYDFSFNFMTPDHQAQTRRVIARATAGRLWLGARLPHHFRNWNWVVIGLQQPLLALAIEGEEGFDPRVYKLGVQIARDYLTYGISAAGSSTEAVGYTQFGFVWGKPFFVAASRRGDNLLAHPHLRRMIDWYIHSLEPFGGYWTSRGDGGAGRENGRPTIWTLMMFRYFFPDDPRVQLLWQHYVRNTDGKPYEGRFHVIEPLLWCEAEPTTDHGFGEKLGLGLTFFDPERGALNVRSAWDENAAFMTFECRIDSHGPSHDHADRGSFTFSALGRHWSRESFRSIESRHHSVVLIDGQGQGYWPGSGEWVGHVVRDWAVIASCDAKPAYDWWFPKTILLDPPDAPRFQHPRWATYAKEAAEFQKQHARAKWDRDDRPSVVSFWEGFDTIAGGQRLWDEDGWPMRSAHNPVQRAFRTIAFVRSPRPYALIVDDIQKDDRSRLYEWLMITGPDTELVSLVRNDAILGDGSLPRDAREIIRPPKDSGLLLVRTLDRSVSDHPIEMQATPSIRLEAFEKKDTTTADGRSFGVEKRLVIPSRSIAPDFRVLLFPHRQGESLPETTWNESRTELTIKIDDVTDVWTFARGADGRTRLTGRRGEQVIGPIESKNP